MINNKHPRERDSLRDLIGAGTNPFRTFVSDIIFSKKIDFFRFGHSETKGNCYGRMVEVNRNIDTKALCVSDFE